VAVAVAVAPVVAAVGARADVLLEELASESVEAVEVGAPRVFPSVPT